MSRKVVMVEYQGEIMSAGTLAKRIGVTLSCISKRWTKGIRGEELVAQSKKARVAKLHTREAREDFAYQQKLKQAKQAARNRSLELRQRARDKAAQVAKELAAEWERPLIDQELVTKAEHLEIASKVKGCQRWNGLWFGESHDSRENR